MCVSLCRPLVRKSRDVRSTAIFFFHSLFSLSSSFSSQLFTCNYYLDSPATARHESETRRKKLACLFRFILKSPPHPLFGRSHDDIDDIDDNLSCVRVSSARRACLLRTKRISVQLAFLSTHISWPPTSLRQAHPAISSASTTRKNPPSSRVQPQNPITSCTQNGLV